MTFIWATRGRSWGFRFLADAGFDDPLPVYEEAFSDVTGGDVACRRAKGRVALRFPDPEGRADRAGRIIPHDFVVFAPLADGIRSVDEGIAAVWPLVARVFREVWALPEAPDLPLGLDQA